MTVTEDIVQDTAYFLSDLSVESNLTFDIIFQIHECSEKNWFPFFLSPKSKMAA